MSEYLAAMPGLVEVFFFFAVIVAIVWFSPTFTFAVNAVALLLFGLLFFGIAIAIYNPHLEQVYGRGTATYSGVWPFRKAFFVAEEYK